MERITPKLAKVGQCLIWQGTSGDCGGVVYGRIRIGGHLNDGRP